MPFEPGQSGNPAGGAKIKRFYAALDRAIIQEDGKRLREAAEQLLSFAAAGESWAIQQLADRLDGKPAQQVQLSGDAYGAPIRHRVEQVIVDPESVKP